MNVTPILAALLLALSATPDAGEAPPTPAARRPAYPRTRVASVADTLHGTRVEDPFRWLEQKDSTEAWAWIEAQNKLTEMLLDQVPGRDAIRRRLTALWDAEPITPPIARGERLFFARTAGPKSRERWLVQDGPGAPPRLILDATAFSRDGKVIVSAVAPNADGTLVAYALSWIGSEWQDWHVREVASGRDRPDWVKWSRNSAVAWAPDGSGFYVAANDAPPPGPAGTPPGRFQRVYFHRLGSAQPEDVKVFEQGDKPDWTYLPRLSDDGRHLVIEGSAPGDRRNTVVCLDLSAPTGAPLALVPSPEAVYTFVGSDGTSFHFRTDSGAPRGRVVSVDVAARERTWRTVIPEQEDVLVGVDMVGQAFVARYLRDGAARVRLFADDATPPREVVLPAAGTVSGFAGRRDQPRTYYSFSGLANPTAVYALDVKSGTSTPFRRPDLPVDAGRFVTTRLVATSKDGTPVPVLVAHRKGLAATGPHPTLLTGFGAFGAPLTPAFSPATVAWMEMGGIYAVATVRGGGELGEPWHAQGMRRLKQNSFDDFVAAAEKLVATGTTSPERLAVQGAAAGGLLVATAIEQRPDLFGAALPVGGFLDMLRFHRLANDPLALVEFGSPDDPTMFPVLRAYSPLHNLKPGTDYPPTLISTADRDDLAPAAHSLKFAAAMQVAQGSTAPVLLRVTTRPRSGEVDETKLLVDEATDRLAFLVRAFGMPEPKW